MEGWGWCGVGWLYDEGGHRKPGLYRESFLNILGLFLRSRYRIGIYIGGC